MSTPKIHQDDRGLAAVRRVRVARENDSRFGLQQATAESRTASRAAERAHQAVVAAPQFGTGHLADFQLYRVLMAARVQTHVAAEHSAATSARIAEEARVHWIADRTAVRSADLLLERRAEVRAEERARREAAALDDLASVGWLRRTSAEKAAAGEGGEVS